MEKVFTITAIVNLVKELTGISSVYPSTFPATSNDECIAITFTGGQPSKSTVDYTTLQVVCRDSHPDRSYANSMVCMEYFKKLRDVKLESGEILVHAKEGHPFPYYLGEDENRRHMYSTTYYLVMYKE